MQIRSQLAYKTQTKLLGMENIIQVENTTDESNNITICQIMQGAWIRRPDTVETVTYDLGLIYMQVDLHINVCKNDQEYIVVL